MYRIGPQDCPLTPDEWLKLADTLAAKATREFMDDPAFYAPIKQDEPIEDHNSDD